MGEQIGKVIKLDYLSQYACRGKYAKFCVELDVTKPLLPMICIEGREYKVEYDGLDVVCFSCFWYGHRRDNCPNVQNPTLQNSVEIGAANDLRERTLNHIPTAHVTSRPVTSPPAPAKVEEYGSWMIVQWRNQRKPPLGKSTAVNATVSRDSRIGNKNGNNNRFVALNMKHGEDLSSQRADSLRNSGRSQNGNGVKNSNPRGKSVVISERDHVRSIREGGSSRATTVLGQLTKWQRKESVNVNGITKKDTGESSKAQTDDTPKIGEAVGPSMSFAKDLQLSLGPSAQTVSQNKIKTQTQRRTNKVSSSSRIMVKRDPKFKGATSIDNLPPPGVLD
ncbi:hypothetical protein SLA2020_087060 [Shorea laevis]